MQSNAILYSFSCLTTEKENDVSLSHSSAGVGCDAVLFFAD